MTNKKCSVSTPPGWKHPITSSRRGQIPSLRPSQPGGIRAGTLGGQDIGPDRRNLMSGGGISFFISFPFFITSGRQGQIPSLRSYQAGGMRAGALGNQDIGPARPNLMSGGGILFFIALPFLLIWPREQ